MKEKIEQLKVAKAQLFTTFQKKFDLTQKQANKVIDRLQEELIKDTLKEDDTVIVDIFFENDMPVMDINSIGSSINTRVYGAIEPDSGNESLMLT